MEVHRGHLGYGKEAESIGTEIMTTFARRQVLWGYGNQATRSRIDSPIVNNSFVTRLRGT